MNRRGFLAALGLAPMAAIQAPALANGGTVRRNIALVGERGPETIMPRNVMNADAQRWGEQIERAIAADQKRLVREIATMVKRRQEQRQARRVRI